MPTTVQKWGNSLGVRVPKAVAEQANLAEGTEVEFETTGGVLTIRPTRRRLERHAEHHDVRVGGVLTIRPTRRRRRSKYKLADLLAKMKGPNPHGEMFGPPVGREVL